LLRELREAAIFTQVTVLANRAATQAGLDPPWGVAALLSEMQGVGAADSVKALASRAANAGMFDLYLDFNTEDSTRYVMGREPDGQPSGPWAWQVPDRS
jgi:hypothetical protein